MSTRQPPTPSQTPPSATFSHSFFRTPKIAPSFHDPGSTWDTDNIWTTYTPAVQTTSFSNERALHPGVGCNRPSSKIEDAYLASQVHHLSPHLHLALPPVEPARQLSSSPSLSTEVNHPVGLKQETGKRSQTVNILPTPPSSGFSKWVHLGQHSEDKDPAPMADKRTIISSTMGPPETPSRFAGASPQLFSNLQFSPDLFQTPVSGPATVLAYPQQRLFWEPSSTAAENSIDPMPYHDPFGPPQNGLVSPFNPSPGLSHDFLNADDLGDPQRYELPCHPSVDASNSVFIDGAAFPAPFTASPRVPTSKTEDLSLFLSSPARRFGSAPQAATSFQSTARGERQPYHHQIEDSKREEELEREKKVNAQRYSGSVHSTGLLRRPASPAFETRPRLKRSSTHSLTGASEAHLRRQSQVSFAESVSVVNGNSRQLSRGRRASPLKRMSNNPFQSTSDRPSSRQRTSLTFTIDRDGRAKTLVTKLPDPVGTFMNLDDSSGDDTDLLDVDDHDMLHSQSNSFLYPHAEPDQKPFTRFGLGSKTHSKNSSYSSVVASSNSASHSSRTSSSRSGPKGKAKVPDPSYRSRAYQQARRNTRQSNSEAHQQEEERTRQNDDYLDLNHGRGDAQDALRALRKDRPRLTASQTVPFPDRPSMISRSFHSSPPAKADNFDGYDASPTTITDPDRATPTTDQSSYVSEGSKRCVCSASSPTGRHFMIQWYANDYRGEHNY